MNYNSIDISILFPFSGLNLSRVKKKTTVVSITFNKKSPRILSIYNLVLVQVFLVLSL